MKKSIFTSTWLFQSKTYDLFLLLISLVLIAISIIYAKERCVYTDTAIYLLELTHKGQPYIPTNRFISVLSQILPLIGIGAKLSLKTIFVLYSLNFILIPILLSSVCRLVLKNREIAFAILMFYIIMGSNLFYYPVSEFQMGLGFLLFFHAFFLRYAEGKINPIIYYLLSAILVTVIIFSHPMALLVFGAWIVWMLCVRFNVKKAAFIFPVCMALLAYFIKEHFFKAMMGNVAFDASRAEGLKNFSGSIMSYFESNLAWSSIKSMWGDSFIAILLLTITIVSMLLQKKWLAAIATVVICFSFWMLVAVTFKDEFYNAYFEHLFQPIPFFIALSFVYFGLKPFNPNYIAPSILAIALLISIAKVSDAHKYNARRIAMYQKCFNLMDKQHIRKAAISHKYISVGDAGSYGPSPIETLLISSYYSPNNSHTLYVTNNPGAQQERLKETKVVILWDYSIPIDKKELNSYYFRLNTQESYQILDSFYNDQTLQNISK